MFRFYIVIDKPMLYSIYLNIIIIKLFFIYRCISIYTLPFFFFFFNVLQQLVWWCSLKPNRIFNNYFSVIINFWANEWLKLVNNTQINCFILNFNNYMVKNFIYIINNIIINSRFKVVSRHHQKKSWNSFAQSQYFLSLFCVCVPGCLFLSNQNIKNGQFVNIKIDLNRV